MQYTIIFKNDSFKNKILKELSFIDIKQENYSIIVPNIIKLESINKLICTCYDLQTIEQILNLTVKIDNEYITFDDNLYSIVISTQLIDDSFLNDYSFNEIFVNDNERQYLIEEDYLKIGIYIKEKQTSLNITCLKYKINSDNVEEYARCINIHPLLPLQSLFKYFEFNIKKDKPIIGDIFYYKLLTSTTGYKKYSNFINNSTLEFEYYNKEYKAKLNDGYISFRLETIGDKFPKYIEFKSRNDEDLKYIDQLKKYFNINQIEQRCEIRNIDINITKLKQLGFVKKDDFFLFKLENNGFVANYNIYDKFLYITKNIDNSMNIKEFVNECQL